MARKNDTAVFTVIFPENKEFFEGFTQSLKKQSHQEFDLVILNDGVSMLPDCFNGLNCLLFDTTTTIAKTRQLGLKILIDEGYKQIVFADSDDRLMANRVEVSVQLLKEADLVANDLNLIDAQGNSMLNGFWKERIENLSQISRSFIMDKNIFGLGNSACRGSFLEELTIPESLRVVDWYIFIQLFKEHHTALFTSDTATEYRIRAGNLGSIGKVNEESVRRCLKVKKQYYKLLSEASAIYAEKYNLILQKEKKLENQEALHKFVKNRAQEIANPFWWEDVMVN